MLNTWLYSFIENDIMPAADEIAAIDPSATGEVEQAVSPRPVSWMRAINEMYVQSKKSKSNLNNMPPWTDS